MAVMRKLIASNKLKKTKEESLYHYHHHGYSTLLTSQVEALDTYSINIHQCLHNLESNADLAKQPEKAVHFNLSPDRINKKQCRIAQEPVQKKKQCLPKMGKFEI